MRRLVNVRTSESGDTLIEVMVAMSVFALVVVGAFSLMNRGAAQMYDSMERSEVRLLINRQIEILTYARDQYHRFASGIALTSDYDKAAKNTWVGVQGQASLAAIPSLNDGCNNSVNAFFLEVDAATGQLKLPDTTIQASVSGVFPYSGNGIWMQKIKSGVGVAEPYADFYVRACWRQNSNPQVQALSTVVRLYDN